jgi:hypothetical protein
MSSAGQHGFRFIIPSTETPYPNLGRFFLELISWIIDGAATHVRCEKNIKTE